MDKKLVITALYNEKKPITYEQPLFKEKDDGMYMNFTESIITQMVKARDEDRFKAICERIQEFIEREGIDVCFAINQNELLDCLNEHQRLKLQIADLEAELAEKDIEIERLKQNYDEVWEDTYFSVREEFELNNNCNECRRYYTEEFNKQLAEKDKEIRSYEHELEVYKNNDNIYANCIRSFANKNKRERNQTAIAELEKVKKSLKHKGMVLKVKPPIELPTVPGNEYLHEFMISEWDFERIFDQQIKELKGDADV
jgi:predicted RNase H-like nuclease (RuvC/YqgF family)